MLGKLQTHVSILSLVSLLFLVPVKTVLQQQLSSEILQPVVTNGLLFSVAPTRVSLGMNNF